MSEPTFYYISVDVETSGQHPTGYSLLSIGACTLEEPERTFYVELKPENMNARPEALAISGFSMEALARSGLEPAEAMQRFAGWLAEVTPPGQRPLFAGFNAPFDWMFVNDYFHRCLGRNPFGHSALDIKSFYMGLTGVSWDETSIAAISRRYYAESRPLQHNALQDALDQGRLLKRMLAEAGQLSRE